AQVRTEGVSQQARPRDEWRAGGPVAARPPSRLLRLLRLALIGARPLDARPALAEVSRAPGGGGDPRRARRAPGSAARGDGGRVLRPAEPEELRANVRLGLAAEAFRRAAWVGLAGRAALGGSAAAARRHGDARLPRFFAPADLSDPHRRPSQYGV